MSTSWLWFLSPPSVW